jgi:hypothetical protein
MIKERFGVVNELTRAEYEKEWQIPMGYEFVSFDKEKAITMCKEFKGHGYIVERITTSAYSQNDKEIVYRTE